MLFMVYFILYFFYKLNRFYEIFYNDITESHDVTYLFTDPDEICTALCKNEFQAHFVHEIFLIFVLFFEIITIIVSILYADCSIK